MSALGSFELLLQPQLLSKALLEQDKSSLANLLSTFLVWLQEERTKTTESTDNDPATDPKTENCNGSEKPPSDPVLPSSSPLSLKHQNLQWMCMTLAHHFEYSLSTFESLLSFGQQHLLLDLMLNNCNLSSQRLDVALNNYAMLNNSQKKVVALFCRWLLRANTTLHLPNKTTKMASIHQAMWLSAMLTTALATLKLVVDDDEKCKVKGNDSEAMNEGPESCRLYDTHYDLASYYLCCENYTQCAKHLNAIAFLLEDDGKDKAKVYYDVDLSALQGMCGAVIIKDGKKVSFDYDHFFLAASRQLKDNFDLVNTDERLKECSLQQRLELGMPITHDIFTSGDLGVGVYNLSEQGKKKQNFLLEFIKDDEEEPASSSSAMFSSTMYDEAERGDSWFQLRKRRNSVETILYSVNPEHLATVFNSSSEHENLMGSSSKWSNVGYEDDAFLRGLSKALSSRNRVHPNLCSVLLSKMTQLRRLWYHNKETDAIKKYLQRMAEMQSLRNLNLYSLHLELQQVLSNDQKCLSLSSDHFLRYENALKDVLAKNADVSQSSLLKDNLILVLANGGHWEACLSVKTNLSMSSQSAFSPGIELVLLMMQYIVMVQRANDNDAVDFLNRRPVKSLLEEVAFLVQGIFVDNTTLAGFKRGRDGQPSSSGNTTNRWRLSLIQVLSKLSEIKLLSLLSLVVGSVFNQCNEDSGAHFDLRALQQQWHLPILVQTSELEPQTSVSNALAILKKMLTPSKVNNDVLLIQLSAETQFAMGHYSSSLKLFLQAILLQTQGLMRPMALSGACITKMVQCCQQLGHHTVSAALCQFDSNFTGAFRALEMRTNSISAVCDAMDGVYKHMWETTILENAVATHTRRGELERRRLALDEITSLEINSNNNEEILTEAAAKRKAGLVRMMCNHAFC